MEAQILLPHNLAMKLLSSTPATSLCPQSEVAIGKAVSLPTIATSGHRQDSIGHCEAIPGPKA